MKKTTRNVTRASKHSDSLVTKLWLSLVRDFRTNLSDPSLGMRHEAALKSGIKTFRDEPFPSKWGTTEYRFKCLYQLENLMKRYIYENDASSEELSQQALEGFSNFQCEIATPLARTATAFAVTQGARRIIKRILGKFNPEELLDNVMFGKRANEGVPYAQSYLDCKVASLSGSMEHQEWFYKEYLPGDPLLGDIVKKCPGKFNHLRGIKVPKTLLQKSHSVRPLHYTPTNLTATTVPKSYKTNRVIVPNTVIGAMYSYGLGRMIETRLASVGLNIRTLQKKHGLYAKLASKTGHLVTADLSKASDLFTTAMVNALVPRDWFNALKRGRIKNVAVGKKVIHLTSFMAMGIGYTFTLETLIFYAILKSIAQLTNVKGLISVYGDDLIYPKALHKYVAVLFPKLGLRLNADKTFVDLPFRESCGSDFYKGVDVRPFQPEEVGRRMTENEYRTFCYKLLNGLLRRWDRWEIPTTVLFLLKEILSVDYSIKLVPPDFPEGSGLHFRVSDWVPIAKQLAMWDLTWYIPVSYPVWNNDLQCHSFVYWREVAYDRQVPYVYPYLWEKLRSSSRDEGSTNPFEDSNDAPILRWVKPRGVKRGMRSSLSRRRLVQLVPVVSKKGSTRHLQQEGF